jgi:hypothetical protein
MHGVRAAAPAIGFSILAEVVFRRPRAAYCSRKRHLPLVSIPQGSGRLPPMPPSPPLPGPLVLMPAPTTGCLTNYWGVQTVGFLNARNELTCAIR